MSGKFENSGFVNTQPSLDAEEMEALLANPEEDLMSDERTSGCHPLATCLGIVLCPLTFGVTALASCFTLEQNKEAVILRYGKYERTVKEPGIHCSNVFGRKMFIVSKKLRSIDLPVSNQRTVIDKEGNPLIVSAVATYQVVNSYRSVMDVEYANRFLSTQGETVLKNVISSYPYEAEGNVPSLRTHSQSVSNELKNQLQQRVLKAGILVHGFDLKEITYAPVIASAMLKRQQAQAIIAARQAIVTGAVDISTHALSSLKESGIEFSQQEGTRMVSNLLTVLCAESDVQPTLPMG